MTHPVQCSWFKSLDVHMQTMLAYIGAEVLIQVKQLNCLEMSVNALSNFQRL